MLRLLEDKGELSDCLRYSFIFSKARCLAKSNIWMFKRLSWPRFNVPNLLYFHSNGIIDHLATEKYIKKDMIKYLSFFKSIIARWGILARVQVMMFDRNWLVTVFWTAKKFRTHYGFTLTGLNFGTGFLFGKR